MPRAKRTLAVWLHGRHLADLTEPQRYRYSLTFTDQALDEHGAGRRLLSLSLPVSTSPTTDHPKDPARRPVAAFLEGLLPEGPLRSEVAQQARVETIDKFSLLAEVGGECAGAVQFLPPGVTPSEGRLLPLADPELAQLVADLPTYHLPEGAQIQASLAGIQGKILVTQTADGTWHLPQGGAHSTHIIKPEPLHGAVHHLVQSENWALAVAKGSGITAADATLHSFDGRAAIVVTRYDRTSDGQRIHQEDFCQALSLDPEAKYESTSEAKARGSRLKRLTALAAPLSASPDGFRRSLLELVTFNVVIGNGDAHSKNYSLLIGPDGQTSMAPLYDSAPVKFLDSKFGALGQLINGKTRISWVTVEDLILEAKTWGLPPKRARTIVHDTIERTWDSIHAIEVPPGTEPMLTSLADTWRDASWLSS